MYTASDHVIRTADHMRTAEYHVRQPVPRVPYFVA
jgi:hypothetical protein